MIGLGLLMVIAIVSLPVLAVKLLGPALVAERWLRRITEAQRRRTGSLAPGVHEVRGRVVVSDGEAMTSRLQGAPCAFYRLEIRERRTHFVRKGGRRWGLSRRKRWVLKTEWIKVFDETRVARGVCVDDGSGPAEVPLRHAELFLKTDTKLRAGFLRDPPAPVVDALREQGLSAVTWFGTNKALRVRETVVGPGDELYVFGEVRAAPGATPRFVAEGGDDDEDDPKLLVTDRGEQWLTSHLRGRALRGKLGAAACALGIIVVVAVSVLVGRSG